MLYVSLVVHFLSVPVDTIRPGRGAHSSEAYGLVYGIGAEEVATLWMSMFV